jgi:hypothetical protein
MTEHRMPARGTVEKPVSWVLVTRQGNPKRAFFVCTHGVDDAGETVHVDQHAETACATEQRMALQPTCRKGCGTERAQTRGLAQQLHVFNDCRRLILAATMAAHKEAAIPVDPHGCAAAAAAGHDGIIGKAGATE